ncbi:MAG: cation transporter [Rhodospirillaceae bacterium]
MGACCAGCSDGPGTVSVRYRRVLTLVLVINAVMFAVEIAWSLIAGSTALQADALDFLADSLTYGLTLAVLGQPLAVRSRAALLKGASLGGMALLVLGAAVWRGLGWSVPEPLTMSVVAALALAANLTSVLLLYRFRDGDANMASVWQCSRNDAIGNLAVIAAAGAVTLTDSGWPDIAVAVAMAGLFLNSSIRIISRAWRELDGARRGAAELLGGL